MIGSKVFIQVVTIQKGDASASRCTAFSLLILIFPIVIVTLKDYIDTLKDLRLFDQHPIEIIALIVYHQIIIELSITESIIFNEN